MTATVYETPAPLAAYLRRATLGLSAAQREEVWNELEEHVLCRAERLELTGLTPDEALAQALRELGPPLRVSAGMNGVHNMPKMIAVGTVTMLAVSAGLYALAAEKEAVNFTAQTIAPKQICLPSNKPALSLERLPSPQFEQCYSDPSSTIQGIFLDAKGTEALLKLYGVDFWKDDNFIKYKLPANWGNDALTTSLLEPKLKSQGHYLYDVSGVLVLAFEKKAGVLLLDNTNSPALYGKKGMRVTFDTSGSEFINSMYANMGEIAAPHLYGIDFYKKDETTDVKRISGHQQAIQTGLKAGEVVGAFQWASSKSDPQYTTKHLRHTILYDVGTVDAAGRVNLHLPENAQFMPEVLKHADSRLLLIRLTNTPLNNLKSGIFLPKS